jgi:fumarate reductase flavoprotein subunit
MSEIDWDVIVIGGGGCGLTAALRAAQRGARVLLLEKQPHLGGNTARSIGSVPGAGSRYQAALGIEDSPERFVADLHRQAGSALDRSVAERLATISAELVHWLVDEAGVALSLTQDYKHIAHSVNRLHNPPSREGAELINDLEHAARRAGVTIETSAAVTDLAPYGDAMHVTIDGNGTTEAAATVMHADAVVLATDGFGAANDLLAKHVPQAASLPYFGGPGNTGDGIRLGEKLGGHTRAMNSFLGYAVMAQPPQAAPSFETMFSWTVIEKGGIIVDRHGRRFADESVGYSAFADDVLRNTDQSVYVIFDQRILNEVCHHEQRFRLLAERPDTPVLGADESGALAKQYDLPLEAVRASLESANVAAEGTRPDEFGRTDFGLAPLTPPLYIAKTIPGVLTTQGGLVVDDHARVLTRDNTPIPRLYAGGGTTAGISGPSRARGYVSGNGLLSALGYGYLAGDHAARLATHG